jgi:hypothetical protein
MLLINLTIATLAFLGALFFVGLTAAIPRSALVHHLASFFIGLFVGFLIASFFSFVFLIFGVDDHIVQLVSFALCLVGGTLAGVGSHFGIFLPEVPVGFIRIVQPLIRLGRKGFDIRECKIAAPGPRVYNRFLTRIVTDIPLGTISETVKIDVRYKDYGGHVEIRVDSVLDTEDEAAMETYVMATDPLKGLNNREARIQFMDTWLREKSPHVFELIAAELRSLEVEAPEIQEVFTQRDERAMRFFGTQSFHQYLRREMRKSLGLPDKDQTENDSVGTTITVTNIFLHLKAEETLDRRTTNEQTLRNAEQLWQAFSPKETAAVKHELLVEQGAEIAALKKGAKNLDNRRAEILAEQQAAALARLTRLQTVHEAKVKPLVYQRLVLGDQPILGTAPTAPPGTPQGAPTPPSVPPVNPAGGKGRGMPELLEKVSNYAADYAAEAASIQEAAADAGSKNLTPESLKKFQEDEAKETERSKRLAALEAANGGRNLGPGYAETMADYESKLTKLRMECFRLAASNLDITSVSIAGLEGLGGGGAEGVGRILDNVKNLGKK